MYNKKSNIIVLLLKQFHKIKSGFLYEKKS